MSETRECPQCGEEIDHLMTTVSRCADVECDFNGQSDATDEECEENSSKWQNCGMGPRCPECGEEVSFEKEN